MGIGRPSIHVDGHRTHPGRARSTYRGSRKRLLRLKWYKHTSIEFWLFVAFVLFLVFVGVPWMINHPEAGRHLPSSTPTATPNP
jgi:hypothetical protein